MASGQGIVGDEGVAATEAAASNQQPATSSLATRSLANRRNAAAGFTLIEILLAIAIAGVAFAVLTQAFANTLRVLISLRGESDYHGDLRFVRNQILIEPDRKKFEEGGEIKTLEHGDAQWEAEVEETEFPDLFLVKLTITLEPRSEGGITQGNKIEDTQRLYLLRPTWSEADERARLLDEFKRDLENRRLREGW